MGLFDKLRGELVDIIEWIDDSRTTLAWRFPRYQNEIKNGAQLIVRPGQKAVFVHRGEIADVFEPGHYELKADNLPLLSTIQGWKFGFNSPFRSEVYFVSTRQVTDLKWGTPNPIMLRDADFGPIRLRAFGTYTVKAVDPKALLKELIGTDHKNRRSLILSRGRPIETPEGLNLITPGSAWSILKTPILSWRGKLRCLWEPLVPRREQERLAADIRRADRRGSPRVPEHRVGRAADVGERERGLKVSPCRGRPRKGAPDRIEPLGRIAPRMRPKDGRHRPVG